jgi:hypothetical protein
MSLGTTWLTRLFIGIPVVVFASCLAAALADSSSPRAGAGLNGPSNFDYLVLASIADSPHLAAMAGYHSAAGQRSEAGVHPTEN